MPLLPKIGGGGGEENDVDMNVDMSVDRNVDRNVDVDVDADRKVPGTEEGGGKDNPVCPDSTAVGATVSHASEALGSFLM